MINCSESFMKFHHRWGGAALLVVALEASAVSHAAPVSGQGTWETTLQARTFDGTSIGGYYDTALNITWLADANYAGTGMNWVTANSWAAGLNLNGITGWRLPTVTDTGTPGCNAAFVGTDCGYNVDTSTGEMAHMYYVTLGDLAIFSPTGAYPQPGWGPTNTGQFSNIQYYFPYWSSTEYAPSTNYAWDFYFSKGGQGDDIKSNSVTNNFYAWAVHPGDVGAAVPVRAAVWLFGSGLIGLLCVAKRRKQ
jgi:hypothetical protein